MVHEAMTHFARIRLVRLTSELAANEHTEAGEVDRAREANLDAEVARRARAVAAAAILIRERDAELALVGGKLLGLRKGKPESVGWANGEPDGHDDPEVEPSRHAPSTPSNGRRRRWRSP